MSEDELRLGADFYLNKLLDRKTIADHFWSGIRVACIGVALVYRTLLKQRPNLTSGVQFLSIYSIVLSTRAASYSGGGDVQSAALKDIKASLAKDEQREDTQLGMIRKLQLAVGKSYL